MRQEHIQFLTELGTKLKEQDNLAPIFVVQQRRKDMAVEGYGDDGWEWVCTSSGDYETCGPGELEEQFSDDDDFEMPEDFDEELDSDVKIEGQDWEKFFYKWRWEFVQPFFTRDGAQAYIDVNGHNLSETRIYVESGWRNAEWEMIRELLMADDV